MIKTELEWHNNEETPDPSRHWDDYWVITYLGHWHCTAMFEDDIFTNFMCYHPNDESVYITMDEVLCWTMLPSVTEISEAFKAKLLEEENRDKDFINLVEFLYGRALLTEDGVDGPRIIEEMEEASDIITDCVCGDTTPHEPWWEDCGLGNSEEHCKEASPDQQKFLEGFTKALKEKVESRKTEEKEPEEDNSFLVANMAQCALCKDVIESHSTHDFVSCSCSSVACDGGLSYTRRVGERENIIELSVYSTDDYETIRTHFKRGSRGVNGDQPLTWVPLKDMTIPHLWATIDYEKDRNPTNKFIPLYEQELKYRGGDLGETNK